MNYTDSDGQILALTDRDNWDNGFIQEIRKEITEQAQLLARL